MLRRAGRGRRWRPRGAQRRKQPANRYRPDGRSPARRRALRAGRRAAGRRGRAGRTADRAACRRRCGCARCMRRCSAARARSRPSATSSPTCRPATRSMMRPCCWSAAGAIIATLSVAVGERMGVIGALSVELAARCLNARDIDGIVIGDGLPPKRGRCLSDGARRGFALPRPAGRRARRPRSASASCRTRSRARDPQLLLERAVPLIRLRAFEIALKRLLKSIECKGMLDAAHRPAQRRCVRPRARARHRGCRRARRRALAGALFLRRARSTAAPAWMRRGW